MSRSIRFGCLRTAIVGLCSLSLVGGLATLTPAVAAAGPAAGYVDAVATRFLENRNAHLVAGTATPVAVAAMASDLTAELSVRESKTLEGLKGRRDRLATLGERYSAARTQATVVSTRQAGDAYVALVNERTELDYTKVHGDEPPFTAFSVDRDFRFVLSGSQWVVAEVVVTDENGVPPINEVDGFQVPLPTGSAASGSVGAPGTAVIARPRGRLPVVAKGTGADGAVTAAAYNYTAMVDYANRYWDNYNTNYRTYSNDCTNFISQAMAAGGWTQVNSSYNQDDSRRWNYGRFSFTTSYTWAGAHNWYFFATGSTRTWPLPNVWDMYRSDVLQVDFDRNGNISHTMIVVATTSSNKYLNYHTNDTYRRSLTSLLSANPSAWYYAHRT